MKGFGIVNLIDVFAMLVLVITLLPAINTLVNDVSPSLDSAQLIIAGLVGLFLLIRVISLLWDKGGTSPQYYYG